jgi:hypothetical protein
MSAATVITEVKSVQALLAAAHFAIGPPSMAAWLSGPMTHNIQQRAQERFLGQGEDISDGGGGWSNWEPLQDSTISWRASAGYGATPINVRTGELESYITGSPSNVTPTGTGASLVYPGTPASGTLATKVQTAQAGKATPQTDPRPVLGLSSPDLEFALMSLGTWIATSISSGAGS